MTHLIDIYRSQNYKKKNQGVNNHFGASLSPGVN